MTPLPERITLTHLGDEKTVTGSCHLLQAAGVTILVDCGTAQGHDPAAAMESWPVKPAGIDYLFLTHAHVDHVGRVPELVNKGFKGRILCRRPTRALLLPMLADALSFSEFTPQHSKEILAKIDTLTEKECEKGNEYSLRAEIRFTLGEAGHILGSSFIVLRLPPATAAKGRDFTILFSGDLSLSTKAGSSVAKINTPRHPVETTGGRPRPPCVKDKSPRQAGCNTSNRTMGN